MDDSYIFFWKPDEQYGVFSPMCQMPFLVEGITYETSIQYIVAKHALLEMDFISYQRVMSESDPVKCKDMGKEIKDSILWKMFQREVVFNATLERIRQHKDAKDLLLSTVPKFLVAANPDIIWGNGLEASHPNAAKPALWPGYNLYGFILMMVRNALENEMSLSGEKCEKLNRRINS